MANSADLSDATFRSDGLFIRMLVDCGAGNLYVDPCPTPGLQDYMIDFVVLTVPNMTVAAAQHLLQGVATGAVHGTVTDNGGLKRRISFRAVMVSGLGDNLFSVTTAMKKGVASLFHPDEPRLLKKGGVVLPMQPLGIDETTDWAVFQRFGAWGRC